MATCKYSDTQACSAKRFLTYVPLLSLALDRNTRLAKLDSPTGPYTALVLAAAGLIRLSLAGRITAFLSAPVLLHSVGQGSLAVEIRSPPANADPHTNREARIARMVARIGDWRATWRAEAERGLLRELEGGCSIPVGVESRFDDHDEVEGKRNEGAAVREVDAAIAPEAPLDTPPVHKVGHVIPASQLAERSQQTRPATLERLATGASQSTTAQNAGESAPSDAPSHLTASANAALSHYSEPEDRSVAPAEGATLHLHAVVVSLDGARSASYTLSGHCTSAAEARDLGVRVARELRDVRGAREILEEVERHRMIAEQADERRRRGEGDKGAQPPGCALRVGEDDLQVQAQAQKKQAQNALDVLVPAPNGEMDRRGLPRDDGQLKAWEV